MITIYTDGSSRGNPGPGGWGAVLVYDENRAVVELGGREQHTTNNRMELTAIREALSYIEERNIEGDVELYTDSSYAMNGLQSWMYGWQKNGWKTGSGDPVLNQDIWEALLGLMVRLKQSRDVDIKKVKGHAGDVLNERCDTLATAFADGERVLLFKGEYEKYTKLFGLEINKLQVISLKSPLRQGSAGQAQVNTKTKSTKGKKAYSYVSLVNGKIHTDKTWDACEKRVKGKAGAKYKKVFSAEEEKLLVREFTKLSASR
jgi:ribonuclease HI